MSKDHLVVDGSNIATEGRTAPSLAQLNDAVTDFLKEHSFANVVVMVDATFPNRIDASERAEYEEAILAGELLTPARRCGGSRRRVRVADRGAHRCHHPLQRLVPGVPREQPVALRGGSAVGRQARARCGLGVRPAGAGEGTDEPSFVPRRQEEGRTEPRRPPAPQVKDRAGRLRRLDGSDDVPTSEPPQARHRTDDPGPLREPNPVPGRRMRPPGPPPRQDDAAAVATRSTPLRCSSVS
jgi:hypothetical protein